MFQWDELEHLHVVRKLKEILNQCRVLDKLHVNKFEMHHPTKHILINPGKPSRKTVVMIDFERCYETQKPQNVTQFIEFICRITGELATKGIDVNIEKIRKLAQEYKKNGDKESFQKIVNYI